MKKKLIWLIIILIIIGIIFSLFNNNGIESQDFRALELNVGDEFTYMEYDEPMYVLNYLMEDVTGDNTKDMVIMIGEKNSVEDITARNIDVAIYEPTQKRFYNLKLKKYEGEMPRINISELTGDNISDIVLTANDKNGNIHMRIVSIQDGEFKEIFKSKDNKGVIFIGNFIDGFKAYIKCSKYNKELKLDLSDRKENYVTNGFFDESGRILKADIKIKSSGFTDIDFVQLDGYYGIQTTQRIIGFDTDDLLDEISVVWKFENGKWMVKEAKGNNIGNLLY